MFDLVEAVNRCRTCGWMKARGKCSRATVPGGRVVRIWDIGECALRPGRLREAGAAVKPAAPGGNA